MSCLSTLSSGGREVAGSSPVIPTKKVHKEDGSFVYFFLCVTFSRLVPTLTRARLLHTGMKTANTRHTQKSVSSAQSVVVSFSFHSKNSL